jgi:hypothetical protein
MFDNKEVSRVGVHMQLQQSKWEKIQCEILEKFWTTTIFKTF